MAELSLFDRLMARRKAIEAGDPTGASDANGAPEARGAVGAPQPAPVASPPRPKDPGVGSAQRRPGETDDMFRKRQKLIASGQI